MQRLATWLILILAFFGLSDSAYLAQESASGNPLICTITGFSDCNVVAQSSYAHVFGIPLADLGVAFYMAIFLLAAIELVYRKVHARRTLQTLAALGLIGSAYFVFIQLSVIDALCIYCFISAGISLLVFILSYFIQPLVSRTRTIAMSAPHSHSTLILPPPHA